MRNRTADLLITNQLLYQLSYVGFICHVTGDLLKNRIQIKIAKISHYNFFATKCTKIIHKRLSPDKPEITNYKHQITNKFQIIISKSQIRSKTNCLEFSISVIVICLVFVFCYLKFFNC